MASVTLQLDDELLADFYAAQGADPDPAWTEAEKDKWLVIMFLEPFVSDKMLSYVDVVRHRQMLSDADIQRRQERRAAKAALEAQHEARIKSLPTKLRQKPEQMPVRPGKNP